MAGSFSPPFFYFYHIERIGRIDFCNRIGKIGGIGFRNDYICYLNNITYKIRKVEFVA